MTAVGGLHILGTERHEARRIDNQLRGRAGRQGDPGSSRFYLSLEDDLMRIFGSDRISRMMETLGMKEGEPIEHRWLSRAIENAQKKVEAHNFDIRKNLLEYDDVMNKQRESVYTLRREILEGKIHLSDEEVVDSRAYLLVLAEDILEDQIERLAGKTVDFDEWDLPALMREVSHVFGLETDQLDALTLNEKNSDEIGDASGRRSRRATTRRNRWSAASCCAASSATSCCRSSTRSGRITSTASTISRKASACAATASAIRSSSTRKKASSCSRT